MTHFTPDKHRSMPSSMNRTLKLLLAGPLAAALLAGCSLLPEKIDETKGWSAQRLYSEAKESMNDGNYQTALGYLDKIQARYPFGRYAQQAQLDTIYVQFKDGEPDAAIAAADRFIKANPRHPYVDYAYYMKGMANFERSNTLIERLAPSDRAKTDTATARQAYNDFSELVRKFPNSPTLRTLASGSCFCTTVSPLTRLTSPTTICGGAPTSRRSIAPPMCWKIMRAPRPLRMHWAS
jgi:tetratricopeptide (TPR) repeat protein